MFITPHSALISSLSGARSEEGTREQHYVGLQGADPRGGGGHRREVTRREK